MIKLDDLCILDDEEYRVEKVEFLITEKNKQEKFIMKLKVIIDDKVIYKMFCKKSKNGEDVDNSKLLYLSIKNFPDGVYLETKDSLIKCHIIELKKKPSNHLEKIGKQMMAAKLHLITLFSILDIDISKVLFNYYVGYSIDIETKEQIHNKQHHFKKIVPGTPQQKISRLEQWEKSIISAEVGKYRFKENVEKIKLDFIDDINNFENYYGEYKI